jgi:hypothetical protein
MHLFTIRSQHFQLFACWCCMSRRSIVFRCVGSTCTYVQGYRTLVMQYRMQLTYCFRKSNDLLLPSVHVNRQHGVFGVRTTIGRCLKCLLARWACFHTSINKPWVVYGVCMNKRSSTHPHSSCDYMCADPRSSKQTHVSGSCGKMDRTVCGRSRLK